MRLTKSQKQLYLLGGTVAAIVVVLGIFVFKTETVREAPYVPKSVDAAIPKTVIEHPEYRVLSLPVDLPLEPGLTGRENPFEPY